MKFVLRQITSICVAAIIAAAAPVGSTSLAATDAQAGDGWQNVTLAAAGFKGEPGSQIDAAVQKGELPNLHAVVVVRGGKLVFERYFEGPEQFWAMPIGTVKFGPEVKHDLRSATKSMVGLLYGIALAQHKVPSLDESLIAQFPEYPKLAADPARRRMQVKHALSMTLGMEWPEDIPYTNATNPELAMYLATDSYQFIFDHRMVAEPGVTWNYCGGATALLGHLIAHGTGKPLFQFAREVLFDPLGIKEVQWVGGTDGEVSAASGLRMRPRDFAKIGQMVLNKGRWENRQVVPEAWIKDALSVHASVPAGRVGAVSDVKYGYQWWLLQNATAEPWFAAMGNGGQSLIVIPSLDLVVAIMAGNYNQPNARSVALDVMNRFVLPALR